MSDKGLDAVKTLLEFIGEDPSRDGLIETPKRVLKAWKEITEGYNQNPEEILAKTFDVTSDEMIFVKNIRFHSTCEHHLLPFSGYATVAYIPESRVVGLSKLARLVECFAKRLQVQERMTSQIADSIEQVLKAKGVGVMIEAHHSCMGCRGIKKEGATMVTSALRGCLKTEHDARAEFLTIANSK